MNGKTIRILYKKELLDVLRDKRTVLITLLLPLVVYPVMVAAIGIVISFFNDRDENRIYKVGVTQQTTAEQDFMETLSPYTDQIETVEVTDLDEALLEETIDAWLALERSGAQTVATLHYLSAVDRSDSAADHLEKTIQAYAADLSEARVKEAGEDVDRILHPVEIAFADASSREESFGNIMGVTIPLLLIMFVFTATFHPAVDLTAGERERGTLEFLLTMPVRTLELMMSKFLAVATIAVVSTIINVISVGIFLGALNHMMQTLSQQDKVISLMEFLPSSGIIFACVLAFSLFISAVCMCVCSFAKTYKEANSYLSPVMVIVLFTAYIAYIPGIRLTYTMALLPVANVCLLIKDALALRFEAGPIMLVFLTNVLYAVGAVWILSRLYSTEAVLFGESGSRVRLFERRGNIQKGSIPSVQEAVILFLALFIVSFYLTSVTASHLLIANVVNQLLFAALPLAACWYIRSDFADVFCMKRPAWRGFAGGMMLVPGSLCLSQLCVYYLSFLLEDSLTAAGETFSVFDEVPLAVAIFMIVILPAVCEELLFRGYLFRALEEKWGARCAILVSSAIFALFHQSLIRLVPTFLIGLCLAFTMHRTGSILSSMCMHALNNLIAVLYAYLSGSGLSDTSVGAFPVSEQLLMLGISLLCFTAGSWLLRLPGKSRERI